MYTVSTIKCMVLANPRLLPLMLCHLISIWPGFLWAVGKGAGASAQIMPHHTSVPNI